MVGRIYLNKSKSELYSSHWENEIFSCGIIIITTYCTYYQVPHQGILHIALIAFKKTNLNMGTALSHQMK